MNAITIFPSIIKLELFSNLPLLQLTLKTA
ncbi:Uncharacterised protein [Escherichia coli]|nr:Uncharacterised protein [Escherichia coli]